MNNQQKLQASSDRNYKRVGLQVANPGASVLPNAVKEYKTPVPSQ